MQTQSAARTTTFLFTDVEGSTLLLKSLREAYGQVLSEHQRLLRKAVLAYGGEEVDTQGDACFFAFSTATEALLAAAAAQRALNAHAWPGGCELRVRMGVHSGRASREDGRFHGVAVHRAARISSAAHGGQVLLSQTTRELFEDEEQDSTGLSVRDLGVHRLKDLDRRVHLYQLVAPDMQRVFAAPRTGLAGGRRRRRGFLVAAGSALLLVVGIAGFILLRGEPGQPRIEPNTLVRIDPETNKVAEVTPVGRRPEGVVISGDGVWVNHVDERTLWRLDRDSGEVTARAGGLEQPGAMMPDGRGGAWVVGAPDEFAEASLYHVGRGGTILRRIRLGESAIWGGAVNGRVAWLTSAGEASPSGTDRLLRVDLRTGEVSRIGLGRLRLPADVAVGDDGVWMPNYRDDSVSRFDPETGRVDRFPMTAGSQPLSVAAAADTVWIGNFGDGNVVKLDSVTGMVEAIVPVAAEEAGSGRFGAGVGPMVGAADSEGVWAFLPGQRQIVRVNNSGAIVARIRTNTGSPSGVAATSESLWATVTLPEQ